MIFSEAERAARNRAGIGGKPTCVIKIASGDYCIAYLADWLAKTDERAIVSIYMADRQEWTPTLDSISLP